jgi:hypothetical protein
VLDLRCRSLSGATDNFVWRHLEECLKAKQDNPEDSQGEPVNLTELHENSLSSSATRREHFSHRPVFQAVTSLPLKKCRASITIPITSRT